MPVCTVWDTATPCPEDAWKWAEGFIANLDGVSLSSSSQVYKGVAEGEYYVGLTWEDPAAAYVRDGVSVKVVFPEEGAIMSGQCVSIIKGAPHMDNAKKFVDYMLGEKCQSYVGKNLTVRPLRADAELNDSLTPGTTSFLWTATMVSGLPPTRPLSPRNTANIWRISAADLHNSNNDRPAVDIAGLLD